MENKKIKAMDISCIFQLYDKLFRIKYDKNGWVDTFLRKDLVDHFKNFGKDLTVYKDDPPFLPKDDFKYKSILIVTERFTEEHRYYPGDLINWGWNVLFIAETRKVIEKLEITKESKKYIGLMLESDFELDKFGRSEPGKGPAGLMQKIMASLII